MAKDEQEEHKQWSKWLEGQRARPPAARDKPSGMTDEELSRAICKVAIDQGIDPNNHGVIPEAEMLSPELLERREMTAKAITSLATTLGVPPATAQEHLAMLGLWAPDEEPQGALKASAGDEEALNLPWEAGPDETALAQRAKLDQLETVADAIAAAKHYDKWLRPLGVMFASFAIASGIGAGAGTGAALFALGYGFFCNGFKSAHKGIEEFYGDLLKDKTVVVKAIEAYSEILRHCPRCGRHRATWDSNRTNVSFTHCDTCGPIVHAEPYHQCSACDKSLPQYHFKMPACDTGSSRYIACRKCRGEAHPTQVVKPIKMRICDRCGVPHHPDEFQVMTFKGCPSDICKFCVPYVKADNGDGPPIY